MKIAHIFASIEPTGGDRISFHHIDGLRKLGHTVDVYYSAMFDNYWKGREFSDESMLKTMIQYNQDDMRGSNHNNKLDFKGKYDMVVSNGLFGSYNASFIDHPLNIWFCQNLDKYVFNHSPKADQLEIATLYFLQKNYMAYSPHLLGLIDHYYGQNSPKNKVLCTNGITYNEFKPFQKKGMNNNKKICFMSAYNGVLKRSKFADKVFEKLCERGYKTVELNAHRKCLHHSQEFYQNPSFEDKCKIITECDIMLHTSSFETWSLVVMESMALGVPVVGCDSKGVSLFAEHNRDMVFIEDFDVVLFCDEIERILSDEEQYLKIQAGGIETSSKYDWDDIMPEIEKSYMAWLSSWWTS